MKNQQRRVLNASAERRRFTSGLVLLGGFSFLQSRI